MRFYEFDKQLDEINMSPDILISEVIDVERERPNIKGQEIGRGVFGRVKDLDDYTVEKTARDPAYRAFVEAIAALPQPNRFLPQVKEVQHRGGGYRQYQIERLRPLADYEDDVIWAKIEQLVDPNIIRSTLRKISSRHLTSNVPAKILSLILQRVMYGNIRLSVIRDPELVQAIQLIQQVALKSRGYFRADIHEDNIMVRPTSLGPQLVINDPLS